MNTLQLLSVTSKPEVDRHAGRARKCSNVVKHLVRNEQQFTRLQDSFLEDSLCKEGKPGVRMFNVSDRADIVLLADTPVAIDIQQICLVFVDQSNILGPTYLPKCHELTGTAPYLLFFPKLGRLAGLESHPLISTCTQYQVHIHASQQSLPGKGSCRMCQSEEESPLLLQS